MTHDDARRAMPRWSLLIAIAVVALAACGSSSKSGSPTTTAAATTTTAASATTTASSSTVAPTTSAPGTSESFVGHWEVHDSQLNIASNTSGVETSNCGPPCVETDTLALSLSADGKRMNVTITKITFENGTTKASIPNPSPTDSQAVGDTSYLQFAAPHLMKETIVHTSLPANDRSGNDYWCGAGLAPSLAHYCGA